MKSNNPQPQSSVPLPREARFNPNGSDLVNEKFNLPPSLPVNTIPMSSGHPANGLVPAPAQGPASSFNYNDPDSFFAFLAPSETPELPELDFPVPGPDVIPDMVFENDHCEESVAKDSRQHKVTPPSINSARASEPYYTAQYAYVPSKRGVRDASSSPRTSSSSSISPSTDASGSGSADDTRSTSTSPSADSLIPIQSSYVAHARVGTLSVAAIQERRARNTQSARRSRARRADKVAELRGENNILLARNKELTLENARLQKLVNTLQMIVPDVKPEVNESPYESF